MKLKNSTWNLYRETNPITVQRGYGVRPNQPAIVQTRCRWIIGDVTEVLDHNKWKLGKITKIVKDDYFVIRLADCIQLKEFHISSLRVPLPQDPPAPLSKQFPAANKTTQRGKQLRADLLKASGKKRKSSAAVESPRPRQRRSTDHSWRHMEEETECSVASCSANDAAEHVAGGGGGSSHRQLRPVWCGGDDAMSAACVVSAGTTYGEEQESDGVLSDDGPAGAAAAAAVDVDVHELELEAYRSTVHALHASGPLTWEQESLLTNLRLSLNISNEEHLLQLRRLLSP